MVYIDFKLLKTQLFLKDFESRCIMLEPLTSNTNKFAGVLKTHSINLTASNFHFLIT